MKSDLKSKNGKSKRVRVRSRNWCFTDHATSIDIKTKYAAVYERNKHRIRYIVIGEEKGKKEQRLHYQGFVQFKDPVTMSAIKLYFMNETLHLEKCKGTELQNDKYCKKDGAFVTFGKIKSTRRQGQRTDLEEVKHKMDQGATIQTVAREHFALYVKFHAGFSKYHAMVTQDRTRAFRKVDVMLIQGPTGTGKTRQAVTMYPNAYMIHGMDMKWWNGYNGETELIIDEYNNDVPITTLLSLLDGYQKRLDVKGSHTYANWNKVIITTNLHKLHKQASPEHQRALARRITSTRDLFKEEIMRSRDYEDNEPEMVEPPKPNLAF